jgi:hypothetical protein
MHRYYSVVWNRQWHFHDVRCNGYSATTVSIWPSSTVRCRSMTSLPSGPLIIFVPFCCRHAVVRVHRAVQPGCDQGVVSPGLQRHPQESPGAQDQSELQPHSLRVQRQQQHHWRTHQWRRYRLLQRFDPRGTRFRTTHGRSLRRIRGLLDAANGMLLFFLRISDFFMIILSMLWGLCSINFLFCLYTISLAS